MTNGPGPSTAAPRTGVLLRDEAHLCRVLGVPFSDEQLAAVTAPLDAPGVVVAGAGSGKTTVMAARVVWLVGRGEVAPSRVLGLTFTTKAAAELDHRVHAALERLAADAGLTSLLDDGAPTVSTYHAFAGSLLAEFGPLLGCEPDLEVVADASRHLRALRVVTAHRHRVEHLSTHLPSVVGDLLALDGQLSDHLVDPEVLRAHGRSLRDDLARVDRPGADVRDAVATSLKRDELLDLVVAYRQAKHEDGVLDFSDQMAWGARLSLAGPEVPAAVRERFGVVLLDEYQDTSVAQRDMLRGLFSGADAGTGRGHPVTAVGDPCQGIYGWRGAAADNLTGFAEDFPASDGGRGSGLGLRVNRRCARHVLDVANTIAAPYYATSEHVRPLLAPDDAPAGRVRAALLPTVADEVDWVADQVAATPADAEGRRWGRVAVLVRDRSEVAALEAALREREVPVEVLGLAGLLQTPAVQDVRAALEVLGDVCANGSLLRLLTGPRWRIGPRDLALLGRRARQLAGPGAVAAGVADPDAALLAAVQGQDPAEVVALAEAVEDPGDLPYDPDARERFREVTSLLRHLRPHLGDPLPDLLRRVVTALDLDVELGALAGNEGRVARDHLAAFGEVVGTFAAREPGAGLGALLTHLRASDEYEDGLPIEAGAEGDAVSVLTAHQAKGLEWDVVHVPFLSGGVFPSAKARPRWTTVASELPVALRGDAHLLPDVREWSRDGFTAYREEGRADAAMEELRLAYVAFTRARHEVVASGHVWGRTQKRPRGASAYLETVRAWLRRHGGDAETWAPDPGREDVNPLASATPSIAWPAEPDAAGAAARTAAAERVRQLLDAGDPVASPLPEPVERPDASAAEWDRLGQIDADLPALLAEAAEDADDVVDVPVPASLSTTALMRLRRDPEGFLRELVRPMPRPPTVGARLGTRFHERVEALLGQPALLADTELPGRQDADVADEAELDALVDAFAGGRYGDLVPHAVEVPFSLWLAGRQVTGRIDAVFATDDGWQVVDWKTGRGDADPWQLGVYRLAWAGLVGVDPEDVDAVFYEVRRDSVVRPDLPGREELEAVLREPAHGLA